MCACVHVRTRCVCRFWLGTCLSVTIFLPNYLYSCSDNESDKRYANVFTLSSNWNKTRF